MGKIWDEHLLGVLITACAATIIAIGLLYR